MSTALIQKLSIRRNGIDPIRALKTCAEFLVKAVNPSAASSAVQTYRLRLPRIVHRLSTVGCPSAACFVIPELENPPMSTPHDIKSTPKGAAASSPPLAWRRPRPLVDDYGNAVEPVLCPRGQAASRPHQEIPS